MPIDALLTSAPVVSGATGLLGTSLRLVDPATETELYAAGTFTDTILNSLDLGYPDIREVTSSRPGQHGTLDSTRYFGARGISAELTFPQGTQTEVEIDRLMALLTPSRRLYLYCQRPGWTRERRILVRPKTFTCPPGTVRKAQLQWQAPYGLLEDSELTEIILVPTVSSAGGMTFPATFPLTFDNGLAPGAAIIPVGGTADAQVVIDIYGPCSDPLVKVVDTQQQVAFKGLDIADGDYLRVDMRAQAAYLNGDPAQSRYNTIDFTSFSWWSLPVGDTVQVVFSASNVSGNCQAVIAYRAAYI